MYSWPLKIQDYIDKLINKKIYIMKFRQESINERMHAYHRLSDALYENWFYLLRCARTYSWEIVIFHRVFWLLLFIVLSFSTLPCLLSSIKTFLQTIIYDFERYSRISFTQGFLYSFFRYSVYAVRFEGILFSYHFDFVIS